MNIRPPFERGLVIKCAVIAILGFLIYSNVLHGEFVCDDYGTVVDNPAIRQLNISDIFKQFNTRFMAGLSFAVNYALNGLNPFGYHLFNIFVHLVNTVLVYCYALRLFQTPALRKSPLQNQAASIAIYTALIFLCHPMQTQAVAYIAQRLVSLATFFYLGTILIYLRARLEHRPVFYGIALLMMIGGLLTKEITFTLPIHLLVIEVLFVQSNWRKDFRRLLFVSGISSFLVIMSLMISLARVGGDLLPVESAKSCPSGWTFFLVELNVLCQYLKKFVFPWPQSHSYDYPFNDGWSSTTGSVAVLALLIVYAVRQSQKNRLAGYAVIWFFLTASVEVAFVVLYGGRGAGVVYDHWLYLPMTGLSLFLVTEVYRRCRNIHVAGMVLGVVVMICGVSTYERNKVWQTEIGLWEDVMRKNPKSLVHYLALGVSYERKDRWPEAEAVYRQGIHRFENQELTSLSEGMQQVYLSRIYNNLGILSAEQRDDPSTAAEYFLRAGQADPHNGAAFNNLRILKSWSPAGTPAAQNI